MTPLEKLYPDPTFIRVGIRIQHEEILVYGLHTDDFRPTVHNWGEAWLLKKMVSQNTLRASEERCVTQYLQGICLHLNNSESAQML